MFDIMSETLTFCFVESRKSKSKGVRCRYCISITSTLLSLIIAYTAPNIIDSDDDAELAVEQPKSPSGENTAVLESSSSDEQSASDSNSGADSEAKSDDVIESDDSSEVEITATKFQQRLALEVSMRVGYISSLSFDKSLKRPVIRRREIPGDKREEGLPGTSHTAETSESVLRSEGNSQKTGHKVSEPQFHSRVKLTTMSTFLLM